jgi:hypothetical protein
MLGTIIEKLSSLVSKAAFVSSSLPLVTFTIANVLLLASVYPSFRDWLGTQRGNPEFWSGGVVAFVIASLAFTTINTRLRELMEGRFWPQFLCGTFTAAERRRLDGLDRRYSALQASRRKFAKEHASWTPRLKASQEKMPKTPGLRYAPYSDAATMVRSLRRRMLRGEVITAHAVASAVDALEHELATCSNDPIDETLGADQVTLNAVIVYAPERTQHEITRLYNQRQFEFPDRNLAPTAMGNVALSIRSYTLSRYQLDIERVWTRLQKVMQGEAFYVVLQESKTQLDFLVSLFWLALTFTVVWVVAFALFGYSLPVYLAVGLMGPLLMWALWELSLQNYRAFADLMRCAVDMYRLSLLNQMRLPEPRSSEEEEMVWTALQNRMDYDNKFSLSYRPPT